MPDIDLDRLDEMRVLGAIGPQYTGPSFVWNDADLQYVDVLSGIADEQRSSEARKTMPLHAAKEIIAKNRQIDALVSSRDALARRTEAAEAELARLRCESPFAVQSRGP